MKKDEIREFRQSQLKSKYISNNYKGYALASPGFGKSKVIIDLIKEHITREPNAKVIVIANSAYLRDEGFIKEVNKFWNLKEFKKYCEVTTYQTHYKKKDLKYTLGIFDEVDFALTEKYSDFFVNNEYNEWLALSGTFSEKKDEVAQELFGRENKIFHYPVYKAIEEGLVNNIVIKMIEVPLSNEKTIKTRFGFWSENDRYEWTENKINTLKEEINNAYEVLFNISDSLEHSIQTKVIESLKDKKKYFESAHYNRENRCELCYSNTALTKSAVELKNYLLSKPNNKVIIFSQRTSDLDEICKQNTYYGNNKTDILDKFNSGEIRELGVVKKVNRGISVENLNTSILHSFTSSDTDFVQGAIGRLLRLPENETAYLYILVNTYVNKKTKQVEYCRSKDWLDSIISETNFRYTKHKLYDFINANPI